MKNTTLHLKRRARAAGTAIEQAAEPIGPQIPPDWSKGQLLNVRGGVSGYRVTLLGEEFDPRSPERCLEFPNSFECQQWVSAWYAREHYDPRA